MTIRWPLTSLLLSFLFLSISHADTTPGEGEFNYVSDAVVKERGAKIDTAFVSERMLLINRMVDGKKRPIATGSLISTQGHFVSIRAAFNNCAADEKVERLNDPRACADLVATYQGKDYSIRIVSRKPMPQVKDMDDMFTHNYSVIAQIETATKAFEIRKPSNGLDIPNAIAVLPPIPFMGAGFDHSGTPHLTWGALGMTSKDQGVFQVGYPANLWGSEALVKAGINAALYKYQVPITFMGGPALSKEGKLAGVMISLMDVTYSDLTDNHLIGQTPAGVFNSRNPIVSYFLEPDASGIFNVEGEPHRLKSK